MPRDAVPSFGIAAVVARKKRERASTSRTRELMPDTHGNDVCNLAHPPRTLRRESYKARKREKRRRLSAAVNRANARVSSRRGNGMTKFRSMDRIIRRLFGLATTRWETLSPRIHVAERSAAGEPCAPKGNYLQRARNGH